MNQIYFHDEITTETVQSLLKNFSRLYQSFPDTPIIFYFGSEGGDVDSASVLIDYLDHLQKKMITLVPVLEICSAAFDVFIKTKAPKRYISDLTACLHTSSLHKVKLKKNPKPHTWDYVFAKNLANEHRETIEFYKSLKILTDEEIRRVKDGKNVWLETARIIQAEKNYSRIRDQIK